MDRIPKSPSEYFPVSVNFSNDLSGSENLTAFTVACVNVNDGSNTASEVIDSSSLSAPKVLLYFKAGTLGDLHKITVKGETDLGNYFEKEVYLEILETISGEFKKQPNDEFTIKVDFDKDLANFSGESIVSVDSEITDENGTDWAATIFSGDEVVDGTEVYLGIQGGDEGYYLIRVEITTTNAYVFDIYVRMIVEEQ